MKYTETPTSSDCRRWRKALRARGADHFDVAMSGRSVGLDADAPVFGAVDEAPHPTRAFVEAWLAANKRRVRAPAIAVHILAAFCAAAALGSVIEKNWGAISHLAGWS